MPDGHLVSLVRVIQRRSTRGIASHVSKSLASSKKKDCKANRNDYCLWS